MSTGPSSSDWLTPQGRPVTAGEGHVQIAGKVDTGLEAERCGGLPEEVMRELLAGAVRLATDALAIDSLCSQRVEKINGKRHCRADGGAKSLRIHDLGSGLTSPERRGNTICLARRATILSLIAAP